MSRWLRLCLLCILAPTFGYSQTINENAQSVVQIRCTTPQGDMKATGFVWPKPGYIVTALHAIAGCALGKGVVYSETAKKETMIAAHVAADLEGDLALLKLADDMGLPAMTISTTEPELTEDHVVWGYPLAAEQMIGLRIEFALGLNTKTTTLGRAFSSSDLTKLFRNQDYPQRNTQIFRITTTIQPGHSGAPIVDAEGRIVAIADGGLLGGWRGINWSIPANVYLPNLPNSTDPFPQIMSEQANLFSATTVRDPVTVTLRQTAASDGRDQNNLSVAGTVSLPLAFDAYGIADDNEMSWMIEDLATVLPNRDAWEDLKFTGLSPAGSDQLIFVTERADVIYDTESGVMEARSTDGSIRQVSVNYVGASFEDAHQTGSALLFDKLTALGINSVPAAIPNDQIDQQLEFIEYDASLGDNSTSLAANFTIQVNGRQFSGRAVHRAKPFDDVSDADLVDYVMMDLATFDLNSLAPLDDAIWDLMNPDLREIDQISAEPSVLTLVRRIPLSRVALEFVEAQDFGWKRSLAGLKEHLEDPNEFDKLAFDIYEDRLTGATIAVPSGLRLVWDPTLGAVKASVGDGSVELAIAVERSVDFVTATSKEAAEFVVQISKYADWDNDRPTDCKLDIAQDDDLATCWGYFKGTDPNTGEFADLYLALDVQDNVLLGTSVYIVGDEDDLSDQESITYRMMLIAAEHLTDFAAK